EYIVNDLLVTIRRRHTISKSDKRSYLCSYDHLVNFLTVVLRTSSKGHATRTPDRALDRTRTRTAGAFLAPRFFTGTSYFSTSLLSTSTLTSTSCISNNNLVNQRFVEITTEGSFGNSQRALRVFQY